MREFLSVTKFYLILILANTFEKQISIYKKDPEDQQLKLLKVLKIEIMPD